ncbi:replication initiation protein [Photobacterium sp. SDRW27]|uniref:replication initiation protein n=1 Tax=Photobacterium obscurum TaxID=2829490 RepID=UPI002243262C|nr:replication initiation protein [Photobacterium obscurum]MCW8331895.1 replication initiation protein [Photobacterium obscurum]
MRKHSSKKTVNNQVIATSASKQLPSTFFKQPHSLLFNRLNLTAREHDIMALLLSRIHKKHWRASPDTQVLHAPVYQFHSDVLCEWFGVKKSDLFNTLARPCDSLSLKRVGITNHDKHAFTFIPLFKRLSYHNATLTIIPNDELAEEYLGAHQGHAQVDHHIFRQLRKEHAKRLYPLLCRFKYPHTQLHPMTVPDLHCFFGLTDHKDGLVKKSYRNNKVFLERCIRAPLEEIRQHDPNIVFHLCGDNGSWGYKAIKTGRKIDKIEFLFSWKTPANKQEKSLRQKLGQIPSPIDHAMMIYQLVDAFKAGEHGNPSVNELNTVMKYTAQLTENGCRFNTAFMQKFSSAMQEAMLRD